MFFSFELTHKRASVCSYPSGVVQVELFNGDQERQAFARRAAHCLSWCNAMLGPGTIAWLYFAGPSVWSLSISDKNLVIGMGHKFLAGGATIAASIVSCDT